MVKKTFTLILGLFFVCMALFSVFVLLIFTKLPDIVTISDYKPPLVSEVFDRNGEKIGEFFKEKRLLVNYEEIPPLLIRAFISAEDSSFFEHEGINFPSLVRAFIANLKAGRKVQGGSTITMQVARSLLLSREKTYIRKIKEILLSFRMENNLSKEEILFLYLNQIYLGSGAYGVKTASKIYFRKPLSELRLSEMALLAGLPQAPSRYSPIYNPYEAKKRQLYVIERMLEEGYLTHNQAKQASQETVRVYIRKNFQKSAPFFLEVIRQSIVAILGEDTLLNKGIRINTGLDLNKQIIAQKNLRKGLERIDKRQGFRGPIQHLEDEEKIRLFLEETQKELEEEANPSRLLQTDGTLSYENPPQLDLLLKKEKGSSLKKSEILSQLNKVKAVVKEVNDKWGFVELHFGKYKGLIDLESMKWARKPDPYIRSEDDPVKKPSDVLKPGEIVEVKVSHVPFYSSRISKMLLDQSKRKQKKVEWPSDLPKFEEYMLLELEQEPLIEGALLSFDQFSSEIIAMVGGYDFERSKFNRSIQASRQTGSAFKSIIYLSALDKGFTPVSRILDSPIIYKENLQTKEQEENSDLEEEKAQRKWRPRNYSNRFSGDILFRNALIRSKNVPTVKVTEKIGLPWVVNYANRLGIFSSLNSDVTAGLGSSSITLYEMTKVFSHIGRLGQKIKPLIIHKIEDRQKNILLENLSLDFRFQSKIENIALSFEMKRKKYFEILREKSEQLRSNSFLPSKNETSDLENQKSLTGKNLEEEKQNEMKRKNFNHTTKEEEKSPPQISINEDPFLSRYSHFFFDNPNQLISSQTAYILLSLLRGVVEERGGTAGLARALNRPVAGKTGTTNENYDAWFLGFTPQIVTGVWVGFDHEKSLGRGETGGRAALPIWLAYMKEAHENFPIQDFPIPKNIVFVNIDNETGEMASILSKDVVRQAFIEGTEPQAKSSSEELLEEEKDFLRGDFSNE